MELRFMQTRMNSLFESKCKISSAVNFAGSEISSGLLLFLMRLVITEQVGDIAYEENRS